MRSGRYFLLFIYAFFKMITIFFFVFLNYLRHPSKLFKKRKIFTCPPFLQDQTYGDHRLIKVNGINLHCVISGPEEAPVMLMLHGFPEFWYSWRYQIREFNKDYRVIAVDLRGYGESDKPPKKSDYTVANTVRDIAELINTLNCGKCTVLAHDWGGIFAWRLVLQHPDLVERFIVMCCPHPGRYNEMANAEYDILFRQWYVVLYQLPWVPEKILSMDDFRSFQNIFKSRRMGFTNRKQLSEDDLQAFLYTFSQPNALTPPLNYYRNVTQDPMMNDSTKYDLISVPTLILFGENDAFASTRLAEGHEKYVKHCESRTLNCGHWLQQDCPEEANALIREFCAKNFD